MKLFKVVAWCVCCVAINGFTSSTVQGYEIDTHSNITVRAHDQSIINLPDKLAGLGLLKSRKIGLDSRYNYSLGINYYDLSSSYPTLRSAKTFDQMNTAVMRQGAPSPKNRWIFSGIDGQALPYFPRDWMARGAVREDDAKALFATIAKLDGEQNALDVLDVGLPLNRFCNHFYDPVNNQALSLGANPLGLFACGPTEVFASGVQWAMGTTNVDGSGTPDSTRKNGFSILDAREAMWRALTGTDRQGVAVATTRADRDAYWATTFRSLGDVAHLLQDLSQPQHTRNEPHPGGEAGYFEGHVNARALGLTKKVPGPTSITEVALPPLNYGNYAVPSFSRYLHYFSTASGADSYTGTGIANYSNRSFFTSLANFGNSKYSRPSNVRADYLVELETVPFIPGATGTYLKADIPDALGGALATQVVMTRESILKEALEANAGPAIAQTYGYMIDERVIDAQADLVIPRAVAYSTGLINFFFRGSLNVEPTSDGVFGVLDHATDAGFGKLVVKVRNTTPAVTDSVTNGSVPQPMSAGKFVAVVRYHKDWKYQNNLSAAIGLGECDTLAAIYGAGNEPGVPGHDPTRTTACRDGNEMSNGELV